MEKLDPQKKIEARHILELSHILTSVFEYVYGNRFTYLCLSDRKCVALLGEIFFPLRMWVHNRVVVSLEKGRKKRNQELRDVRISWYQHLFRYRHIRTILVYHRKGFFGPNRSGSINVREFFDTFDSKWVDLFYNTLSHGYPDETEMTSLVDTMKNKFDSNRTCKEICKLCLMGRVDQAKWLLKYFDVSTDTLYTYIKEFNAKGIALDLDRHLSRKMGALDVYMFSVVCSLGHQTSAQWLADEIMPKDERTREEVLNAFRSACERGDIPTASMIFHMMPVNFDSIGYCLAQTCINGYYETAEWIFKKISLNGTPVTCSDDMTENPKEYFYMTIYRQAENMMLIVGDTKALAWLRDRFKPRLVDFEDPKNTISRIPCYGLTKIASGFTSEHGFLWTY